MVTHQPLAGPISSKEARSNLKKDRHVLEALRASMWVRIASTTAIAGMTGVFIALLMPRGPVVTWQALLLMATGLLTGVAAGFVSRSRWAMLLAPLAHVAAFELTRSGSAGPTVDGIHVDTTFGILAFILGRGVYGILGLLPMILGVSYGRALARLVTVGTVHPRSGWRRIGFYVRRGIGGLATAGMVALAIWCAIPASVAPLLGADGQAIPGSVTELTSVHLGGHDQWIQIRGASPDKPVLLYLTGGPGQSDLAFSRVLLDALAQDFLVVGWDQRGTGKSYPSLDPSTLTLEGAVDDTVELTNYLRNRFDEQKIYLLGESWGSTLGVLAAQQHPELYHAVLSSGQMVSERETDQRIYADLLAYAERTGDTALATTLRGFGQPPYEDLWAYPVIMAHYNKLAGEYDPPQAYQDLGSESGIGFYGVMRSEYAPIDKVNVLRGLIDTFAIMYPQLQEIDFRQDVPRLEVPIYLFEGTHELEARSSLAREWFDMLDAPEKQLYTFDNAGHSVAFEQYEEVHRILMEIILPATYPDTSGGGS